MKTIKFHKHPSKTIELPTAILQESVKTKERFITVLGNWHPIDPIEWTIEHHYGN